MPCSCGYQGSGTAAFYEALGAKGGTLFWVSSTCQSNLQYVDPMLELKTENIGWNLISGGQPPSKTIDYGQGYTATVPTKMPTACFLGTEGCGGEVKSSPGRPPPKV